MVTVTVASQTYYVPETGESNWGDIVTDLLVAISGNAIWGTGGVVNYLVSATADPATAGIFRLAHTDAYGWRDYANTGNLLLKPNASSDVLEFTRSGVQKALAFAEDYVPKVTPVTTGNLVKQKSDGTVEDAAIAASDVQTISGGAALQYVGTLRQGIMNGEFLIWQRNTTFTESSMTPITDGTASIIRLADRWSWERLTTADVRVEVTRESTIVPDGFTYSMCLDVKTAESALAVGEYAMFRHRIEGYDFAPYLTRSALLSFKFYPTQTGTFCVAQRNGAKDKRRLHEVVVTTANTWQDVTIPVTFNAGGTWAKDNTTGLEIDIVMMAGSDVQGATVDAWVGDGKIATSNQSNWCSSTGKKIYLAAFSLHAGSVALPYLHEDFGQLLSRCMRYYEKSYNYAVAPGTADMSGMLTSNSSVINSGSQTIVNWSYKVLKRFETTAVVPYSPQTGAANSSDCYNNGGGWIQGNYAAPGDFGESGWFSVTTGLSSGYNITIHFVADAEL